MAEQSITILSAGKALETPRMSGRPNDALWVSRDALGEATGWSLKPEGLCRGAACTIVSERDREACVEGDAVWASELWRRLGRPVLHDDARRTWVLGEAPDDRNAQLASLRAPDFTLPDLEGRLHSLSVQRGKKALLYTWASW